MSLLRYRTLKKLGDIAATGKITPGQAQYLGRRVVTEAHKAHRQKQKREVVWPEYERAKQGR